MDSLAKILSDNIERERTGLGLSQAALGQELGVQGLTVYRWEAQKTWPTAKNVEDMAKVFGVPAWSLYTPHKRGKAQLKLSEPDPKLRQALGVLCRALGFALAPSRPRRKS